MRTKEPEAAYQRLARELREAILQHRFPDGVRLPTEAELAQQYQVSRQTVRRAFQDLVTEGMVFRVPGRGSFPATRDGRYLRQFGSVEDLMSLSVDTELEILRPLQREVDIAAASRLRLDSDVVSTIVFQRRHEGAPFCVTTVHLPPVVGRSLERHREVTQVGAACRVSIIGLIDARRETTIAAAEQSITAVAADKPTAKYLGCEVGHPVLRIDRVYFTGDGRPVELAISYFLPELYSYRVELRRSLR